LKAAVQQQQQQLPRNSPAAEFEQLKEHAAAATMQIQRQQRLLQQAEQRRLRQAVAAAYTQHRWQNSAQSQANVLLAEQHLTDYEVQQHKRQSTAADALWELYFFFWRKVLHWAGPSNNGFAP
jgi:hypothetical protein